MWHQRGRPAARASTPTRSSRAGGVPVLLPPASATRTPRPLGGRPARRPGDLAAARTSTRRGTARSRTPRTVELARRTATPGSSPCSTRRPTVGLPVLGVCRGMQVMAVARRRLARPAHARPGRPRASTAPAATRSARSSVRTAAGSRRGRGRSATTVDGAAATTTSRCATHPGFVATAWRRRRDRRGDGGAGRPVLRRRAVAPGDGPRPGPVLGAGGRGRRAALTPGNKRAAVRLLLS